MGEAVFLRTIRLRHLLSFGPDGEELALEPLNVVIGPNASGKSNLIEAIGLLRAAPSDLAAAFRQGGGVAEWLWKGAEPSQPAEIEITVGYPSGIMPLRYRLEFTMTGQRPELVDEAVENHAPGPGHDDPYFFYRYQRGRPILNVRTGAGPEGSGAGRVERALLNQELDITQSVLSQRRDPDQYPELTFLGRALSQVRIYRDWNLGRFTPPRLPQKADLPEDFLLEDASNLGLVLNDLEHRPGFDQRLLEGLRRVHEDAQRLSTRVHGGTVQLFLHQHGLVQPVPATRMSDGTLRFLCLLAILCHPEPPPLICIEEPELGLHPDVLPMIADMLLEASQRTQLVVTTHSDVLVSGLSERPECVVVCERGPGGTEMHRLSRERLGSWLEDYALGDVWRMGEIGGNRL